MSFQSFRNSFIEYSTRRMSRGLWQRMQYSYHIILDAMHDLAQDAARMGSGRGDSTALAEIGRDGGLRRAETENDDDFRPRVRNRWVTGKRLGMAGELARQVSLVFWDSTTGTSPRVTVFRQRSSNGHGIVVAVANGVSVDERYLNGTWDWDGDTGKYWRLFIHVEDTTLTTIAPRVWGDGFFWGDGVTRWGVQLTGTQLLSVAAAINDTRGAKCWIPFLMIGPPLDPEADYGTLLPQLSAGAVSGGPGAWTYNHQITPATGFPTFLPATYERRPIGLPNQTLIAIDTRP